MKAPIALSSAVEKALILVAFLPVVTMVYPETASAAYAPQNNGKTALVFQVNSKSKTEIIPEQIPVLTDEQLSNTDLDNQTKITYKQILRNYLVAKQSPFADCVDTIVELKNADKILALANAESALGRRAPVGKHNYWGIGGSNLWKMGNNVCEGIVSMDNFLNEYPRRSAVKYTDMSFVDMCGLYKQPCPGKASHHWVKNNLAIINDLTAMKGEASMIAKDKVEAYKQTYSLAFLK